MIHELFKCNTTRHYALSLVHNQMHLYQMNNYILGNKESLFDIDVYFFSWVSEYSNRHIKLLVHWTIPVKKIKCSGMIMANGYLKKSWGFCSRNGFQEEVSDQSRSTAFLSQITLLTTSMFSSYTHHHNMQWYFCFWSFSLIGYFITIGVTELVVQASDKNDIDYGYTRLMMHSSSACYQLQILVWDFRLLNQWALWMPLCSLLLDWGRKSLKSSLLQAK